MLLYSVVCLCFLIAFHGGVISKTIDEVIAKVQNRHMLTNDKDHSLINLRKAGLHEEYFAGDCRIAYRHGRRRSGLYIIRPKPSVLLAVYCDMEYAGGGWTVVQKNDLLQKTSWARKWNEYKYGFGSLSSNHWLGNELLNLFTNQNGISVRFVITDSKGEEKYAEYESFKVENENGSYTLRLGNYSGNAGDALTVISESGIHDNMWFSTSDRDNDRRASTNCAQNSGGGWWYDNCYSALLTGDRIYWKGLCSDAKICKSATILIRRSGKNCNIPSRY